MSQGAARPGAEGQVRALAISLLAAAVPIAAVFFFPEGMQDYEALTWLLLLVPAFLWAYERGWRGVATALALGMAALSLTYAAAEMAGRQVPDLLLPVVVLYVALSVGIGLFGDRVTRANLAAARETLALQDQLTRLPNRRQAEMHTALEFAAAERGRPLAVILFDIDDFSAYNAQHGRAAGDGVLKGFATMLRQHTRRMDLSGRYGPEEFISVLTGCPEEGAIIFASRLQERMRAAEHTVTLPTISAGIASYRQGMASAAELLAAAEEALRLAKREGGDRVRIHGRSLEKLEHPGSTTFQAQAAAMVEEAVDEPPPLFADAGPVLSGHGRTAFLLIADDRTRAQLGGYLHDDGVDVIEGTALADTTAPLHNEFDLVFVDVAPDTQAVVDMVRELRLRSPATRVIGVVRGKGRMLPPDVLRMRVDAHVVASASADEVLVQVHELLRERDALVSAQLRHRQLSNELRVKDREARAALAASEAKYRSVVQSIKEVIFTTDAAGRWTFLNPAWTVITGFDVEESLGRPLFDFLHPAERDHVQQQFRRLLEQRVPYYRYEGRWRTRSGEDRWIELRLQLTQTADGQLQSASGVLADVTERRQAEAALRQSEAYFRSLIENSADMMAVLNADGTLRYVSPAVERVFGLKPQELIGTNPLERVYPGDVEASRTALARLLGTPGHTETSEVVLRHADGSYRHIEMTGRNLLLMPGVHGVVVNARDITERRETEEALRASEELLMRAQKMDAIGRLAGGVAHDFNNLLTAIQGHADLLLADIPAEDGIRPDLMEIRDAAGRATSLTRQLLAFSRRQVLQPRALEVNAVIGDMEKMLRRVIGADVVLSTDLSPEAGFVRADPAQIEQVLLNLLVNARDAMPRGGRITISTAPFTVEPGSALEGEVLPGAYVKLRVHDDGTGMSGGVARQAFEPFFTTKGPGHGTGLGLSTVYGIAKQSGGHVWLESEPGVGTQVTLILPAAEPVESLQIPGDTTAATHRGQGLIMLVEDEKAVRDLTLRILTRQGYEVLVAASGIEALELLEGEERRIDLLITDVVMPELAGQELAERVRAARPGTPVLFISGYNEEAVLRHGVLAAGTTFLEKPFSPSLLLGRVRTILAAAGAGAQRAADSAVRR